MGENKSNSQANVNDIADALMKVFGGENKQSVSKNVNIKVKTDGVKDLELLNKQLKEYESIRGKGQGKQNYYDTKIGALNSLTVSYNKYLKAKKDGKIDVNLIKDKNAKEVLRYANAFEALGGSFGDLKTKNKDLYEFIGTMRSMMDLPQNVNVKNGFSNYSVDSFKEFFDVLKRIQSNGFDMSQINKNFDATTRSMQIVIDKAHELANATTGETVDTGKEVAKKLTGKGKSVPAKYRAFTDDNYQNENTLKALESQYNKNAALTKPNMVKLMTNYSRYSKDNGEDNKYTEFFNNVKDSFKEENPKDFESSWKEISTQAKAIEQEYNNAVESVKKEFAESQQKQEDSKNRANEFVNKISTEMNGEESTEHELSWINEYIKNIKKGTIDVDTAFEEYKNKISQKMTEASDAQHALAQMEIEKVKVNDTSGISSATSTSSDKSDYKESNTTSSTENNNYSDEISDAKKYEDSLEQVGQQAKKTREEIIAMLKAEQSNSQDKYKFSPDSLTGIYETNDLPGLQKYIKALDKIKEEQERLIDHILESQNKLVTGIDNWGDPVDKNSEKNNFDYYKNSYHNNETSIETLQNHINSSANNYNSRDVNEQVDVLIVLFKQLNDAVKQVSTSLEGIGKEDGFTKIAESLQRIDQFLEASTQDVRELTTALSGIDLNLSFNLTENKNPIKEMAKYGQEARQTIDMMTQSYEDLKSVYSSNGINESSLISQMMRGSRGSSIYDVLATSNNDKASKSSRMSAYKVLLEEAKTVGKNNNIDLSSWTDKYEKNISEAVSSTEKLINGEKETEEVTKKLLNLFGGSNNINLDGVITQLDTIIDKLQEIIKLSSKEEVKDTKINTDSELKMSEDEQLKELERIIEDVTLAVDDKTAAFKNEEDVVKGSVASEVAELGKLITEIGTVATKIDELNNDKISLNIDESLPESMNKLVDAIERLKVSLNGIEDGGLGFLSGINELASKKDELANLSSILKSTEEKINSVKNKVGSEEKDNVKDKDTIKETSYDSFSDDEKRKAEEISKKYKEILGDKINISKQLRNVGGEDVSTYKLTGKDNNTVTVDEKGERLNSSEVISADLTNSKKTVAEYEKLVNLIEKASALKIKMDQSTPANYDSNKDKYEKAQANVQNQKDYISNNGLIDDKNNQDIANKEIELKDKEIAKQKEYNEALQEQATIENKNFDKENVAKTTSDYKKAYKDYYDIQQKIAKGDESAETQYANIKAWEKKNKLAKEYNALWESGAIKTREHQDLIDYSRSLDQDLSSSIKKSNDAKKDSVIKDYKKSINDYYSTKNKIANGDTSPTTANDNAKNYQQVNELTNKYNSLLQQGLITEKEHESVLTHIGSLEKDLAVTKQKAEKADADKIASDYEKSLKAQESSYKKYSKDNGGSNTAAYNKAVQDRASLEEKYNKAADKGLFSDEKKSYIQELKKGVDSVVSSYGTATYGVSAIEEGYTKLIASEEKYNELRAKNDNGVATSKEVNQLKELTEEREKQLELIKQQTSAQGELTNKEGQKKDLYTNKQEKGQTVYDDTIQKTQKYKDFINNSPVIANASNSLNRVKSENVKGIEPAIAEAEKKINDLNIAFAKGEKNSSQYKSAVESIVNSLSKVVKVIQPNDIESARKAMSDYFMEMSKGKAAITNITDAQNKYTMTGEWKNDDGNIEKRTIAYDKLSGSVEKAGTKIKTTESLLGKLTGGFKDKLVNLATYLGTFVGLQEVWQVFKQGVETVTEFDTALTEMRKVSDESLSTLQNYQGESFDIATEAGTNALQIQESTADFMRLGDPLEDAKESAKQANILMNVSEFDNIDDATQSLIAMRQAYKDVDQASIVDKLNEVGNNYSISTDELAAGLQRSGSVLSLMGNSIDEASALITAGNATIQNVDSVAAGVKTIALRIVGTEEGKQELSDSGEDVSDYIVQTASKKQEIIKKYTATASNPDGVDILDDNGNYKNTYEILKEIGEVYKEIVADDKKFGTNRAQALVEELAGKNRSNIVSSILTNSDQLELVKNSSENSDNSAEDELQKQKESITGRVQELKNQLQELAYNLINSDLIKKVVNAGISIIEVLNNITGAIGGTQAAFLALGTAIAGFIGTKALLKKAGFTTKKSLMEDNNTLIKDFIKKMSADKDDQNDATASEDSANKSEESSRKDSTAATEQQTEELKNNTKRKRENAEATKEAAKAEQDYADVSQEQENQQKQEEQIQPDIPSTDDKESNDNEPDKKGEEVVTPETTIDEKSITENVQEQAEDIVGDIGNELQEELDDQEISLDPNINLEDTALEIGEDKFEEFKENTAEKLQDAVDGVKEETKAIFAGEGEEILDADAINDSTNALQNHQQALLDNEDATLSNVAAGEELSVVNQTEAGSTEEVVGASEQEILTREQRTAADTTGITTQELETGVNEQEAASTTHVAETNVLETGTQQGANTENLRGAGTSGALAGALGVEDAQVRRLTADELNEAAAQRLANEENARGASGSLLARGGALVTKGVTSLGTAIGRLPLMGGIVAGLGATTVGAVTGVGLALGAGVLAWNAYKGAQKRAAEEARQNVATAYSEAKDSITKANEQMKQNTDTVDSLSKRYAELSQNVNLKTNANIGLNNDEYNEFLDTSNQLAEIFPELTNGYDDNGNAILNLSGGVDTITGKLKDLLEVQQQLADEEIKTKIGDLTNGFGSDIVDAQKVYKEVIKTEPELKEAYETITSMQNSFKGYNSVGYDGDESKYENALNTLGLNPDKKYSEFGYGFSFDITPEDIEKQYNEKIKEAQNAVQNADNKRQEIVNGFSSYWSYVLEDNASYLAQSDEYKRLIASDIQRWTWESADLGDDPEKYGEKVEEYVNATADHLSQLPENVKAEIYSVANSSVKDFGGDLQAYSDYIDKEIDKFKANDEYYYGFSYLNKDIKEVLKERDDNINEIAKDGTNVALPYKDEVEKLNNYLKDNGIVTQEAIEEWNKYTEGCTSATDAIKQYEKAVANAATNSVVATNAVEEYHQALEDSKKLNEDNKSADKYKGNVNQYDRPVVYWDEANLKKYKEAYKSWGYTKDDLKDTYSTLMGGSQRSETLGGEILYTPMFKDSNGNSIILTKKQLNSYIEKISSGATTKKALLSADKIGASVDIVNKDGKVIGQQYVSSIIEGVANAPKSVAKAFSAKFKKDKSEDSGELKRNLKEYVEDAFDIENLDLNSSDLKSLDKDINSIVGGAIKDTGQKKVNDIADSLDTDALLDSVQASIEQIANHADSDVLYSAQISAYEKVLKLAQDAGYATVEKYQQSFEAKRIGQSLDNLWNSSDFSETKTGLEELANSTGITADKVIELSNSNYDLMGILDETGMSASYLASCFNDMALNGTTGLEAISADALAVNQVLSEMSGYLDDASDAYTEYQTNMNKGDYDDNLKNYEVANKDLDEYFATGNQGKKFERTFKYLYGDVDINNMSYKDMYNYHKSRKKYSETKSTEQGESGSESSTEESNWGINFLEELYKKQDFLKELNSSVELDKDGNYIWNIDPKDFADIGEEFGLTTDYVTSLIESLGMLGGNFKDYDTTKLVDTFKDADMAIQGTSDTAILCEDSVKTLFENLGYDDGTYAIEKMMKTLKDASGIKMLDFSDSSKDNTKNILNTLKKYADLDFKGTKVSLSSLIKSMKDLGMSQDQMEDFLGTLDKNKYTVLDEAGVAFDNINDAITALDYDPVNLMTASLAKLKNEAVSAERSINAISQEQGWNQTFDFDFNTQNAETAQTQIDNFTSFFNEKYIKDGKINLKVEGAREAQTIMTALMQQKQSLEDVTVMQIDVSKVTDSDLASQLKELQEFVKEKNTIDIKMAIGEDTSDLDADLRNKIMSIQESGVLDTLGIKLPFKIDNKSTSEEVQQVIDKINEFATGDNLINDLELNCGLNEDSVIDTKDQIGELTTSLNDLFNGERKLTFSIDAGGGLLGQLLGGTVSATIGISGDGTDAKEEINEVKEEAINTRGTIGIDGDNSKAKEQIAKSRREADSTTGTVKINGDNSNAKKKTDEVKEKADRTKGTISIDGNNSEANKATDQAKNKADKSKGTIKINANASPFKNILDITIANARRKSIVLNVSAKISQTVTTIRKTIQDKVNSFFGKATGTAYEVGSAYKTGTATTSINKPNISKKRIIGSSFATGSSPKYKDDWSIGENGTSLGGELGEEIVVRDGKFFTVGENGAEFFKHKKNDIIFNATQSKAILKYGGIKGANPRGKAFANGSFPSRGNAYSSAKTGKDKEKYGDTTPTTPKTPKTTTPKTPKTDDDDDDDKKSTTTTTPKTTKKTPLEIFQDWFGKLFDWIEVKLERQTNKITNYLSRADEALDRGSYDGSSENYRNAIYYTGALADTEQQANKKYLSIAKSVLNKGVKQKLIKSTSVKRIKSKVADGTLNISEYSGKAREVVESYQEWYNKAKQASDAIKELHGNLQTYIADLKQVADAQRDATIDKYGNYNTVASSAYAYTSGQQNSQLNYNNHVLQKNNEAYSVATANAKRQIRYSSNPKAGGLGMKAYRAANSQISKGKDRKNKSYRAALTQAKKLIKAQKSIDSKTLATVKKHSLKTYEYLYSYNLGLKNYQNSLMEEMVNYAATNAEYYSNKNQQYENNKTNIDDAMNVIDGQYSNASSTAAKNKSLDKKVSKYGSYVANDDNAINDYTKSENNAKAVISKQSTKGIPKNVAKYIKNVKDKAKAGGDITKYVPAIAAYVKQGYIPKSFYNACQRYMNARSYKQSWEAQKILDEQTLLSQKSQAISTKLENSLQDADKYTSYSSGYTAKSWVEENKHLDYNNSVLKQKNQSYADNVTRWNNELDSSRKNSTANRASSSIKADLKGKNSKSTYSELLNEAKGYISKKTRVPGSVIDKIAAYNGKAGYDSKNICAALNNYNDAYDASENAKLEYETNYAINSSEIYNNLQQKYDNKKQRYEEKNSLLDQKAQNADSATTKNKYINSKINNYEGIIKTDNDAISEYGKAVNTNSNIIKKGAATTKAKNDGATKKVNELIKKVESYRKKASQIPDSVLKTVSSYGSKGWLSDKYVQACCDYNEALGRKAQAEKQLELDKATIEANKVADGTEKLNNTRTKHETKLNDNQADNSILTSKQSLKTTKGADLTSNDYNMLIADSKKRENILKGEKTDLENTINDNLSKGLWTTSDQEYKDAMIELKNVDASIIGCQNSQLEYNNAINTMSLTNYEKAIELLNSEKSLLQSVNDLAEAQGKKLKESDYRTIINKNNEEIDETNSDLKNIQKEIDKAKLDPDKAADGKTLKEWQEEYNSKMTYINNLKAENEGLYDSIWQTYVEPYETAISKLQDYYDLLDKIGVLLNENNLIDEDTGAFTEDGIAQMALYTQQYENAREQVDEWKDAITKLDKMYADGTVGMSEEEYYEKRQEYLDNYFTSASQEKEVAQSLIQMWTDKAQTELDILNEIIDKRKEALQAKKDYYDWDRTLRDKTKDLQALDAQIAALGGIDTAEARSQLAKLQAERQEAQEDMDDTINDHLYELKVDGLDELQTTLQDNYDDYVKSLTNNYDKITEVITQSTNLVTNSYDAIENAFANIFKNYGVNPSDYIEGYATGSKSIDKDKMAWTQENGSEIIVRKSDGAILTPLGEGDGVIPNNLTENLYKWGSMNPDSFTKGLKIGNIPKTVGNSQSVNVHYDSLINVEGDVSKDTLPALQTILEQSYNYTVQTLTKEARMNGIRK